jgi:hypothetical protein
VKGLFLHIVIILFAIFRIDFICSTPTYNTGEELNDIAFVLDEHEKSFIANNDINKEYTYTETFYQSKSFRGSISNKIKTVFPYICNKKDNGLKNDVSLQNNRFICQYHLPSVLDGNKSMVLRL